MPPSPDPPFDSQPQGISLDELAAAFAQVMGVEPRRPAESTAAKNAEPAAVSADTPVAPAAESPQPVADDACPISPRTIFEAMLFVGNRENRPLSVARAAELMRDVQADEIPPLIDELNRRYAADNCPYEIAGEGDGCRLTLRREHHPLRNRFYGRIREARLSQAAIDVLALVAYQQPIAGEKIGRLRGRPSRHVLAHLVRRGLLRIERPDAKPRTPHYLTTDRFLKLFNLQSLDDLPRSEDPDPP
jgi:segregation and condensation protein B